MIVDTGKPVITQVFSGQQGRIADEMLFGTGTTPPALGDTALGAEAFRTGIKTIAADPANNRIVFKVVVPAGAIATVSEIGLSWAGTLVARTVLDTPWTMDTTIPTEVEYSLAVNFS